MKRCFWAILTVLFLLPPPLLAAAWVLPKGKKEFYQSAFYYSTEKYFDMHGQQRSQPRYSKFELNPYAEYGWRESVTLGGTLALARVDGTAANGQRGANFGIGDPSVFLRSRLWHNKSSVISVQPLLKLPSVYQSDILPRSGSRQIDTELRLLGGHNFTLFGRRHFATLEAAYRKRFDHPGDQWRAEAALGFNVSDRWQIIPQISAVKRVKEASVAPAFTQNPDDDFDLLRPQISAVYTLTPQISVQAGAYRHLAGRNTGAGDGVLISLWWRPLTTP